jgi:hypothetical protein
MSEVQVCFIKHQRRSALRAFTQYILVKHPHFPFASRSVITKPQPHRRTVGLKPNSMRLPQLGQSLGQYLVWMRRMSAIAL